MLPRHLHCSHSLLPCASAFALQAREWHPDRHQGEAREKAEAKFQEISEAFQVLSDPIKRTMYDERLDAATTKGVVARLIDRGLVQSRQDGEDLRRLQISLTGEGQKVVKAAIEKAQAITSETTERLTPRELARLLALLDKL